MRCGSPRATEADSQPLLNVEGRREQQSPSGLARCLPGTSPNDQRQNILFKRKRVFSNFLKGRKQSLKSVASDEVQQLDLENRMISPDHDVLKAPSSNSGGEGGAET